MVTGNMGQLMPIGCVPVLPGDTFQANTSALIRVSPLNTPVMHPVKVRVHHFFVPNRIVMPDWEDFITGGPTGNSFPSIPQLQVTATGKKELPAYLGVPPINGLNFNALAVRGFNKIFNEYYRDQDLVTERTEDDVTVPHIAWEKDYFSSARPWAQKGPSVSIPMGDTAPIAYDETVADNTEFQAQGLTDRLHRHLNANGTGNLRTDASLDPTGTPLVADLSQATSPDVNDWRAAFALQRYQEARARYGSRFTEYLRYLGVNPSDQRLQRPEWLGGGTTRLSFSEVLQTGPDTTDAGVGDMYGHGIAGIKSNKYRKFFEEHGYVYTLLSVRPKAIYMNGTPREYIKATKEDFYQRELVNLGQQEVYESELFANNSEIVFGFQDRYHEYRSHPSQIQGDFRDTLNAWHLGRELQSGVTLNEDFVKCDPSRRIFQITDETVDTLWIMANNHIVARRLVPKRANPRIM